VERPGQRKLSRRWWSGQRGGGQASGQTRQWARPEEVVQAQVAWSLQRPGSGPAERKLTRRWWPGHWRGQASGSWPGGGGQARGSCPGGGGQARGSCPGGGGQASGSCPGGGGLVAAEVRPVDRPVRWWPGQWTDQAMNQARGSCPGAGGQASGEARQWTRPEEVVQAVVAWSLQRPGSGPGRWWPVERLGSGPG